MKAETWQRIDALFHEALHRTAEERTAWLREECGGETEVYRQVIELLEADADGHNPLERAVRKEAAGLILSYFATRSA